MASIAAASRKWMDDGSMSMRCSIGIGTKVRRMDLDAFSDTIFKFFVWLVGFTYEYVPTYDIKYYLTPIRSISFSVTWGRGYSPVRRVLRRSSICIWCSWITWRKKRTRYQKIRQMLKTKGKKSRGQQGSKGSEGTTTCVWRDIQHSEHFGLKYCTISC